MKKWFDNFYKNNKAVVWAATIAIVLSLSVILKIKDEVTRFTLIMPLFAGFILFSILMTPDEDLDDKPKEKNEQTPPKKSPKK